MNFLNHSIDYNFLFLVLFAIFVIFLILLFSKKRQLKVNRLFKLVANELNYIIVITDQNGNILFKNNVFDKYRSNNSWNLNETFKIEGKNSIKEPLVSYMIKNKNKRLKSVIYSNKKDFPVDIKLVILKNNFLIFLIKDISFEENHIEKIKKSYYFDPITKIPNKIQFFEKLDILITKSSWSNEKFVLMLIDIANFSNIINILGIDEGNKVLEKFAAILKKILKNRSFIAKLEKAKFAVIIDNIDTVSEIQKTIAPLLNLLKKPIKINNHEIDLSVKIGSVFFPYFNVDKDTLIKYAEFSLAEAYNTNQTIAIFTNELKNKLGKIDFIINNLPIAIKNNELQIYLQPKLNLKNNQVTSAEVLIRWNHPQKGFISPDTFIPIAEKTGYILDIGEFVIDSALKFLYERKRLNKPLIKLAINISQKQLTKQNIVNILSSKLKKYNIESKYIELEITESSIMENENQAISQLEKLQKLGFCISLDDFGTGFSSLNLLTKLPINKIKIDKSFIDRYKNKRDLIVLHHIVYLAYNLNLKIVIEGIENKEQFDLAKKLKCYEIQGYIISKPLGQKEFSQFLRRYRTSI